MKLWRTANAGALLEIDGITVLLDGVCRERSPYFGTPDPIREQLYAAPADITAFTHGHLDHFDRGYARSLYTKTLRPILGPECLLKEGITQEAVTLGGVTVQPIATRHLGKAGLDTPHVSFLIRGSQTVLFTGDATPLFLRKQEPVDVLIAPYAYAITPNVWELVGQRTKHLVLVHMPPKTNDPLELWPQVEKTVQTPGPKLWIPEMGEKLTV